MKRGAIILCGGKSSRMGRDKASLPFGGETLLERTARLVCEVVPARHIVCVAAPQQQVPELAAETQVVCDARPHEGPLAGLAHGLGALGAVVDAAFVTGCDAPLLEPRLIEFFFSQLADRPIAAVHDGQRWHPLPAVYRTSVAAQAGAQLATGERSLTSLIESLRSRRISISELKEVDPQLSSLRTCNTLEEYQSLLREAGFTSPE